MNTYCINVEKQMHVSMPWFTSCLQNIKESSNFGFLAKSLRKPRHPNGNLSIRPETRDPETSTSYRNQLSGNPGIRLGTRDPEALAISTRYRIITSSNLDAFIQESSGRSTPHPPMLVSPNPTLTWEINSALFRSSTL